MLEQDADTETTNNKVSTPVLLTELYHKVAVVQCLLDHGAEINARNQIGNTPIMAAALKYSIKSVWGLIDKADIQARNNDKWTSLHLAANAGHPSIVRLLLEYNAVVNVSNINA